MNEGNMSKPTTKGMALEEVVMLSMRLFVLCSCVALLAGCASVPQATMKEVSFDLNKQTVSSVRPGKATSGYGLQIKLSDYGWNQLQRLLAARPQHIVLLVNGTVLSREMLLGGSFPREFFWVRELGVDELTKEQAESLTKQILGN
jgi:hypothetical protein